MAFHYIGFAFFVSSKAILNRYFTIFSLTFFLPCLFIPLTFFSFIRLSLYNMFFPYALRVLLLLMFLLLLLAMSHRWKATKCCYSLSSSSSFVLFCASFMLFYAVQYNIFHCRQLFSHLFHSIFPLNKKKQPNLV